ncbi:MarR family winged helix-turn-helix transcriptional regulator [Virgisporangium ochraceum]|uniref:MarR family transcriptional regulator n=1 Tax=Virgisporangium ochraceum TaxID=65505 RepID=A0A8J3ZJY9_9ACTN|nr:MarR family transcriptional regulator [Virgisporangium ochraceum]GIJ65477.1 MarR family transcriptional regulator [Virgisporangium ochraceum]
MTGENDCCEPAWLDDLEIDAWRRLAAVLTVLPSELDAQMQRRADLNQFEYHVLSYLSEAPAHTLRISDLALLVRGSLSRMSHLIKRLEQRGWLRREPAPDDGRYTNAILTEAGYRKVVDTAPIQLDVVRQLVLGQLTRTQLKQLRDIGDRLLGGVDSFRC